MGVTIKDIAEKTGLSITTISLVLNKKESRIPEKTRQIVENTALELHYLPNQAAKSLATRKTNAIGLIIPEGSYYRPDDMILSFDRACRNSGYSLSFAMPEQDDDACTEALESMLRRGVDGVIFDGAAVSESLYGVYRELIQQSDTPVISLAGTAAPLPESILPDYRQGARLAVSHLLGLGHRHIGCILGSRDSCAVQDILKGIEDPLREADLDPDAAPVLFTSYTAAGGYGGLDLLLKQDITGIFAGSDILALGILRRAYELGVSIPGQLSVVGYGNSYFAGELYVPLTSVAVHFDRIARKAVHVIKMFGQEERRSSPEPVQPSLIVRSSTAAPAEISPPFSNRN
jgi:LacI family transcriptional regulator